MSIPLSQSKQVDIGEAFGFVFRSHNWFGRLTVGALCLLFFWLFFIPLFILLGYFVETARTISRGGRELPPWSDVGTKLREGFVLAVVLFIWGVTRIDSVLCGQFPHALRGIDLQLLPQCPGTPGRTLHAAAWLADSGHLEPVSGRWLYSSL